MIDISLLRLMKKRKDYYLLRNMVDATVVSPETKALLDDFGKYYEKHPDHPAIMFDVFIPRFKAWHPSMKDERFNQFVGILRNVMQKEADENATANIINELHEMHLLTRLANIAEQYNNGDLPNAAYEATTAFDEYRLRVGLRGDTHIDIPIADLLRDEFDDAGLSWPITCLNGSMRGLRPGDFGIVAARPDAGKTTFLSHCATHWAGQLPPERNVLWLNNEGPGRRIIPRLYQSALNYNMDEMKANLDTLEERYVKHIGRRDRIRVIDIHEKSNAHVELLIEANNPGVIIYDMIDSIRGFNDSARTDLALEHMYQWSRERSVKYDAIGIASSQISNEGDGEMYPSLGALKDSKTGKQGACDFQIMIGKSNDPIFTSSRFISVPKNKLRRVGTPGNPRCEVIFDAERSRYRDLPIETGGQIVTT